MASEIVKWAAPIEMLDGATASNVGLGNWYRNTSSEVLERGRAQGWLDIVDLGNTHVFGARTDPTNERLEPAGASWTAATAALQPGTYGVKLALHVDGAEAEEAVGTLIVAENSVANSVSLRTGTLPDFRTPMHLDVDPAAIAMYWSGEVDISIVDGDQLSIAVPFSNVGEQEVEISWIQATISPLNEANGAYMGQH